ncbi:nucleotidyltransferase domain-containing protein [Candidatus Pacearchaeota archaeon]|nr:nucleotidyltransferase domain-containing protein [Candidatus Pacearchaeota archaeon]
MIKLNILTRKENEVLNKKLNNKKLTQVESNYLSRAIRPKLRNLEKLKDIDMGLILQRIEYNQKGLSVEHKIKKLISEMVKEIDSIIAYGSAIQTNYSSYNDIDVLVLTKKKLWSTLKEKYALIKTIKGKAQKCGINLDIQIMQKQEFYAEYPSSPTLIYQLKDSKIIYGEVKIPNKTSIHNIDLKMKLDWSEIEDIEPKGTDIYIALRNVILVRLLLNKIVDNQKLKESLNNEIGKNLINKLKNNKESKIERRIALNYLKELLKMTREEIRGNLWGKAGL